MRRRPVQSSNIVSVGYDPDWLLLEVEFKGERVYQYSVVPEYVYQELLAAESVGSHFIANIRDRYPVRQVSGPRPEREAGPHGVG